MKKNVNLKPSQEYTKIEHYIIKKIKHSKIIFITSIFVIKYSLSYNIDLRSRFRGTLNLRIRTWVPNADTPVIYGIKRLNKILKSQ